MVVTGKRGSAYLSPPPSASLPQKSLAPAHGPCLGPAVGNSKSDKHASRLQCPETHGTPTASRKLERWAQPQGNLLLWDQKTQDPGNDTGLGFSRMHGVDGSRGMLEIARQKGLYQELKHCILGQEPLPVPTGQYDAVIIVGALSEGQVPCSVVPELLRVTKPGGFLCLTTRTNVTNLQYMAKLQGMLEDLEEQGLWAKVSTQEVEKWEKATSEQESTQNSDYISGALASSKPKSPFPLALTDPSG
uniref:Methyltransferase like 27 n=1 Tax=Crocodylus porosus TaxID=8502 RepID=A0A7M4EKV6_CROPO